VTFTFLRFFIASLFLLPAVIRSKPKINKDYWKIILLSLFLTADVTLFSFGVKLTTAMTSQLLYSAVPVASIILSYFFLKEKITSKKILAIILGLIGTCLIILLPDLSKSSLIDGSFWGNLLILAAVIVFSCYGVFSKRYQGKYSPLLITFTTAATTTVVLSLFALLEFTANPSWISHLSSASLLSTFYTGICGGAGYYLLLQYAIKKGSPTIASMVMFIQPAAAFIWASFLLGEKLTLGIILGGILTLIGAYIITFKSS